MLATARFDARPPDTSTASRLASECSSIEDASSDVHSIGAEPATSSSDGRPSSSCSLTCRSRCFSRGAADAARPDRLEADSSSTFSITCWCSSYPMCSVTYSAHPVVQRLPCGAPRPPRHHVSRSAIMATTIGAIFRHVDHVFTTVRISLRRLPRSRSAIGASASTRRSTRRRLAPDHRAGSSPSSIHRGRRAWALFARLTDIWARAARYPHARRPVGVAPAVSTRSRVDFTRYRAIMAAPALPRPADFFALTRFCSCRRCFATTSDGSPPRRSSTASRHS